MKRGSAGRSSLNGNHRISKQYTRLHMSDRNVFEVVALAGIPKSPLNKWGISLLAGVDQRDFCFAILDQRNERFCDE